MAGAAGWEQENSFYLPLARCGPEEKLLAHYELLKSVAAPRRHPRIVRGGMLSLDDYGTFAGQDVTIQKLPFATTPCFLRTP